MATVETESEARIVSKSSNDFWSPESFLPVNVEAKAPKLSSFLVLLPMEVQVEILKQSVWKDVLNVRMTCKCLFEATKEREVWVYLVEGHIFDSPCPPRLERPLSMFSSSELEQLLLVWKSTEVALAENDMAQHKRVFSTGTRVGFNHLVKGGRWLLIVHQTGAVICYDLDAGIITGTSLIPQQLEVPDHNILVSVDYDAQSPTLRIILALSFSKLSQGSDHLARFQIWSIDLVLDSSNHGIQLFATHIAAFSLRSPLEPILSLSLFGPNLAFFSEDPDSDGDAIFIVCWAQVTDQSPIHPWRLKAHSSDSEAVLYLLSGSRILVISDDEVALYDYDYSTTKNTDPEEQFSKWEYTFDEWIMRQSERFDTPTTTRVICLDSSRISCIDIGNDPMSNVMPSVTALVDIDGHFALSQPYLGYTQALIIERDDNATADLLQYPHEYHPEDLNLKPFHLESSIPPGDVLMDEHTGRIVVLSTVLGQLSVVIDLALAYNIV